MGTGVVKIDEVHEKGICVELKLDKKTGVFFGHVDSKRVEGTTKDAAMAALRGALADFNPYVWEKRIVFSGPGELDQGSNYANTDLPMRRYAVEVGFCRVELAKRYGAEVGVREFYARRFAEDITERDMDSWKFRRDRERDESTVEHYLADSHNWTSPYLFDSQTIVPYTPELWAALESMAAVIEKAHARLSELLAPEDKGKLLSTAGANGLRLLQAPAKAKAAT